MNELFEVLMKSYYKYLWYLKFWKSIKKNVSWTKDKKKTILLERTLKTYLTLTFYLFIQTNIFTFMVNCIGFEQLIILLVLKNTFVSIFITVFHSDHYIF